MLAASLNEMIREKTFQIAQKAGGRANRCQSDFLLAQQCSVEAMKPMPMGPGPHPRYRMISYDDMMLTD
ncbi:hypothetical protein BOTU111921_21360 [Bordetella tumbae]